MDKRFWLVVGVIVVIFGGILWFNSNKQNNTNTSSSSSQPTNHVEGNTNSKVKLVEYGDFQCPYCGQYFAIVEQVFNTYKNQISFQFRNLPLTQVHQNAFAAARAAEAAGLQGQYWPMYSLLYQQNESYYNSGEKGSSWISSSNPETYFVQDAQQLGLNTTTFQQDYASSKVNNLINADVSAFNKTGLSLATPTFLLNGKQIQPTSLADFTKLINAALATKN
jgi:protein-disulfide isomerase